MVAYYNVLTYYNIFWCYAIVKFSIAIGIIFLNKATHCSQAWTHTTISSKLTTSVASLSMDVDNWGWHSIIFWSHFSKLIVGNNFDIIFIDTFHSHIKWLQVEKWSHSKSCHGDGKKEWSMKNGCDFSQHHPIHIHPKKWRSSFCQPHGNMPHACGCMGWHNLGQCKWLGKMHLAPRLTFPHFQNQVPPSTPCWLKAFELECITI